MSNLLVELFVEELPPKALHKLGQAFSTTLFDTLKAQGLIAADSVVTAYASPRRLAAHITQVAAKAVDKAVAQKLMPVSVGLDADGNATPALQKKLAALGADVSVVNQLKREHDGKTDVLFLDLTVAGATLTNGLQKALDEAIAKLPIPKVMTYQLQDGWSNVNFVRPAHGLVALHGNEVIPINTLGLSASNQTLGHRFEAAQNPIVLRDADSYALQLQEDGAVIPGFNERKAEIARQLERAAAKLDLRPIEDEALLDEVTALVERPNVLVGQFEEEFLAVPQECLILTMKANQKYFPLLDAQGKLTNKFLIVSNITPANPSAVIGGNERVVRPRLSDAKFFFEQDRKKTLESRIPGLAKVVYHNKLGSQGERIARVSAIANLVATALGDQALAAQASQAAQLAKADLVTDMVGEFPELQGIMGRYYAQHEGLSDDIAYAIEDHYRPRFAGDELPRNRVGLVVALADKLETLVGMFSIGEKPTGEKDPFALRRHAIGILRILTDGGINLELDTLLQQALSVFHHAFDHAAVLQALEEFIFDRLAGNLRDQGYSAQEVDSVLALKPQLIADIQQRLAAVHAFAALNEAPSLAAANKRVGNILKKSESTIEQHINPALLQEDAEKALAQALAQVQPQAQQAFVAGDYTGSLKTLAALKVPVDAFFDGVMVNADDPALKANRLSLLATLHQAMNQVADLSRLAA
ncbi:glycyl-tRNA synthetase beta chain [Methylobacillus rhizosphaerae]|uniref:Glycine--tRNA ligase beta subunit n=1 Tax=Methylobacillus rhizosphaerae TaxID=551994 RepID=A0A239ACA2_9PROT|nr:glycine--tRNA ligase subunit beta [Methylobacillus rhizosphaerae]SNR92971.1 glycyl-tRNA synthetase beta chain [Methylobacillus rhizosphaerae]